MLPNYNFVIKKELFIFVPEIMEKLKRGTLKSLFYLVKYDKKTTNNRFN